MKKTHVLILLTVLLVAVGCANQDSNGDFSADDVGPGMMGDDVSDDTTMMDGDDSDDDTPMGSQEGIGNGGTAWGSGAFDSNGELIYFTATNEDGEEIDYSGGPDFGMMMGGNLACASCHGPRGRGGEHVMQMEVMDAPAIYWSALAEHGDEGHDEGGDAAEEGEHAAEAAEYGMGAFRLAVVEGLHPSGEPLSEDMPRWDIGEEDLADLAEYLKTLP